MRSTMKTLTAAALSLALALPAYAGSMEHGSMKGMDHGAAKAAGGGKEMSHEGHRGDKIHESAVEGYRFAYHLIDNAAQMAQMKDMKAHDMSQMKSHHLMLYLVGPDGKKVEGATLGYMVTGPNAVVQKTMAMGMEGGYGADVDLAAKGKYEIKTKMVAGEVKLVDDFTYEVK